MTSYSYELKIAKDRVAVLIGKEGIVKKSLEENSECKINIDSVEGEVKIFGEDPIKLFALKNIVLAIGRGFNPDIAQLLFKQDFTLELLHLKDYVNNDRQMLRLKGRIIGERGKSRRTIEDLTECYISVYGKTVSLIGSLENIPAARQALEMLLEGANHSTVFKHLEKRRRNINKEKAKNLV